MSRSKNDNKYLKILLDHLAQLPNAPDLQAVLDYLGRANDDGKNFKRQYFPSGKGNQVQTPFPVKLIRQLYLGFDIPYEKFILSGEEMQQYKQSHGGNKKIGKHLYTSKDQILTPNSPHIGSPPDFQILDYSTTMLRPRREAFIKTYVNILRPYFEKARKSITVYEYHTWQKIPFHNLRTYGEAHEVLFRIIEQVIRHSEKLKYNRYLALPFGPNEDWKKDPELVAIRLIISCSMPLFEHICRCFNDPKLTSKATFHFVPYPIRPYHFGIIDKQFVLSEYSRFSTKPGLGLMPSLLFIDDVCNSYTKYLEEVYSDELQVLNDRQEDWFINSKESLIQLMEQLRIRKNEGGWLDEHQAEAKGIKKILRQKEVFFHKNFVD